MQVQRTHTLRQFTSADLEAVTNINRVCLPENYASSFFIETSNAFPEGFAVAESGGCVVGYIMCRIEHGLSDLKKLRLAKKGHIISVAVIPEHRQAGIGYSLVQQVLSVLSNLMHADECYLEVRVTNEPAINLYKKMNFDIARTIPHYYFDGSNAYLMSKSL